MFDREVLEATRALCTAGGSLASGELQQKLQQRFDISEEEFIFIVNGCSRFLLVRGPSAVGGEFVGDCTVVARTSLRLCSAYSRGKCAEDGACQHLHLCRFFIYGNCRFGKGRKPCKFCHDFRSEHNYRLLRECTLHELDDEQLILLLLQNDNTLLPEVCSHYNKGSPPFGDCTFKESCTKVHLCLHFVQGTCAFGLKCKRQHAFSQHGSRMLEERGLSRDVIQELPFIYRNIFLLTSACTEKIPEDFEQSDEICLHFIRNSCRFNNECRRVHFHLPYKWELFDGVSWTDLPDMEDIERDYCDPFNTHSLSHKPINFLSMRRGSRQVRRLSTVSSVTRPPHYVLTTDWLWYYKGEQGNWIEYGQMDEKQRTMSVTSQSLENLFLSDRTAEVQVMKGHREYILSFKDMYQRNPKHNTKRRVRRRPRFVSVVEVQQSYAKDGSPMRTSPVQVCY
ncbi:protein mono-ADP-ribosyltransferase PARP12b [Xyrichtys novacula]|uniref:Protein mono-ADP-ribosyltransferase PARP12b n=1 Tax=Xyrichtys novacula TaxID=13765 RepID=A0AAV1F129_XYRNO|nr:protein mono-ADP-ribosyltransferase PARP12b [Xyrichtys novacula]